MGVERFGVTGSGTGVVETLIRSIGEAPMQRLQVLVGQPCVMTNHLHRGMTEYLFEGNLNCGQRC